MDVEGVVKDKMLIFFCIVEILVFYNFFISGVFIINLDWLWLLKKKFWL